MLKTKKGKAAFGGVILAVFLSFTVVITYSLMKRSVKDLIISNIDELADHDVKSIQGYVSGKLDSLQQVVDEIKLADPKDVDGIRSILRNKVETDNFTKMGLIDEEGNLYTYKLGIVPKEKIPSLNISAEAAADVLHGDMTEWSMTMSLL